MLQLAFIAILILIFYLLSDILRKFWTSKNNPKARPVKEDVVDITNAWIDLNNLPYTAKSSLLTPREAQLYNTLHEAVHPGGWVVLPKLRLADIIGLTPESSNPSEYLRRLKERHCDFLVSDPEAWSPLLLIFTESNHEEVVHRQNREFGSRAAAAAGLPWITINLERQPDAPELMQALRKAGLSIMD